ncbi:TonB-dependent receptor [Spongiivirga citrea]|uniref:TonB-dependent receptor n=1 Tax=Spongiivirga citrea TaxID=1481457 RepID=A0A6M0CI61_9FLAO|nr:TonB-dependent receptor [Spongiivirga citrea]NER17656.1 TonB-dependent receptor [Spongiivirga citrea]
MRIFIVVFFLLFMSKLFSHDGGFLNGTITHNDEPVPYVSVYVEGTDIGTTTNNKGEYELKVGVGTFTLLVRTIGFKQIEQEFTIKKHEKLTFNFELKEEVLGLNQVVVSATRGLQNRKEAPVIVTITDEKIFNATQSISLSEGLNFQPGLRMETNCQNCGFAQVRMNGLNGAYSQILIDSRPIFSALNGVYGLDQIPANIIDRIEVVRGGGSALYGSNAIAGTINVITKEALEDSFQLGSNLAFINGIAPDRSLTLNGTVVSDNNKAGITFFGLYRDRNPFDYQYDGFTEITTMENTTLGFKTYYKPDDQSKVSLDFHHINEFRRGGDQLNLQPFESEITEQIDSKVTGVGLTYELFDKLLKNRYSLYVSTQLSNNQNYYGGGEDLIAQQGEVIGFGTSEDNVWVAGGQFSRNQDKFLGGSGVFTGGIEFKYNLTQDAKPGFNAFVDQTVRIYGLYSQQEWQLNERLKLLGGVRVDIHNITDEAVNINPRLNVLYDVNDNLQLRTSYAKGFRAAQFFTEDLHATLAAGEVSFVRFAPNLKSETSHSFLASADWSKTTQFSEVGLTIEAFYTRLQDPFVSEQATDEELAALGLDVSENQFIYIKKNSTGANVYGVNMEAKYAPNEKWTMQLGGTIQQSIYDEAIRWSDDQDIDLENADQFFKSPNLYGNFVVTFAPTKKFQHNLSAVYTGRMYVPHIAGFIQQDRLEFTKDFFELNFKSSYTFDIDDSYKIQLSAGMQNVFNSYQFDFDLGADRDANYIYGPSRPRTYFVGLKIGTDL